jgi:hypothetical protein
MTMVSHRNLLYFSFVHFWSLRLSQRGTGKYF